MESKESISPDKAKSIVEEAENAFLKVLEDHDIKTNPPDKMAKGWLKAAGMRIIQENFEISRNGNRNSNE